MDFDIARTRLLKQLDAEIQDKRVLAAMSRVPRECFVPEQESHLAYENIALPIGLNQTISQPYIVALMTERLQITPEKKVLEIGTGSGYQTAILAELSGHVVTTERLPELLQKAQIILNQLGYTNIETHLAGETLGWKEGAPYDAIITTAGAPQIPESLINQLAVEGRLVIPIGSRHNQELLLVIRHEHGNEITKLCDCRFVSLIGNDAWDDENKPNSPNISTGPLDLFKTRRSIRKYKGTQVYDGLLLQVLEAGRWAPSWKNSQCWRFIIVKDTGQKAQLAETLSPHNQGRNAIISAPVLIIACAELKKSGFTDGEPRTIRGDWGMFDTGLALENMALMANILGLGTLHIGLFDHKRVETLLGVPEGFCVVEMMPLGYPDGEVIAPPRKALAEIVYKEKFGGS